MNILNSISDFLKKIFSKNFNEINPTNTTYFINSSTTTSSTTLMQINTTLTTNKINVVSISNSTYLHLIDWEKKHKTAYDDGAGYMTIGIGHAIFNKNETFEGKVLLKSTLTDEQIYRLLDQDLYFRIKATQQINKLITHKLEQYEFDALVLFAFNTGTIWNALAATINSYFITKDVDALKKRWRYYNFSNGKIMAGLVNRREGELDLFLNQYKGRNYYNKSKTVNNKLIIGYY